MPIGPKLHYRDVPPKRKSTKRLLDPREAQRQHQTSERKGTQAYDADKQMDTNRAMASRLSTQVGATSSLADKHNEQAAKMARQSATNTLAGEYLKRGGEASPEAYRQLQTMTGGGDTTSPDAIRARRQEEYTASRQRMAGTQAAYEAKAANRRGDIKTGARRMPVSNYSVGDVTPQQTQAIAQKYGIVDLPQDMRYDTAIERAARQELTGAGRAGTNRHVASSFQADADAGMAGVAQSQVAGRTPAQSLMSQLDPSYAANQQQIEQYDRQLGDPSVASFGGAANQAIAQQQQQAMRDRQLATQFAGNGGMRPSDVADMTALGMRPRFAPEGIQTPPTAQPVAPPSADYLPPGYTEGPQDLPPPGQAPSQSAREWLGGPPQSARVWLGGPPQNLGPTGDPNSMPGPMGMTGAPTSPGVMGALLGGGGAMPSTPTMPGGQGMGVSPSPQNADADAMLARLLQGSGIDNLGGPAAPQPTAQPAMDLNSLYGGQNATEQFGMGSQGPQPMPQPVVPPAPPVQQPISAAPQPTPSPIPGLGAEEQAGRARLGPEAEAEKALTDYQEIFGKPFAPKGSQPTQSAPKSAPKAKLIPRPKQEPFKRKDPGEEAVAARKRFDLERGTSESKPGKGLTMGMTHAEKIAAKSEENKAATTKMAMEDLGLDIKGKRSAQAAASPPSGVASVKQAIANVKDEFAAPGFFDRMINIGTIATGGGQTPGIGTPNADVAEKTASVVEKQLKAMSPEDRETAVTALADSDELKELKKTRVALNKTWDRTLRGDEKRPGRSFQRTRAAVDRMIAAMETK